MNFKKVANNASVLILVSLLLMFSLKFSENTFFLEKEHSVKSIYEFTESGVKSSSQKNSGDDKTNTLQSDLKNRAEKPIQNKSQDANSWQKYFPNAEILDSESVKLENGSLKYKTLIKTNFKYPYLVAEEVYNEKNELVSSISKVANHIIVSLKPGETKQNILELNDVNDGALFKQLGKSPVYIVRFDSFDLHTVDEKVSVYSTSDSLKVAEPDYIQHLSLTPNDPSYDYLYGLHNTGQSGGTADADIDAPDAWELTTGSADVLVGVIDTGIDYNHEDLADNMWVNPNEIPGNNIDDDNNGYVDDIRGWDFVNNDNDPMDDHFHGTHCAGTIGAVGNNGVGLTGVAWNVSLVGLKFLSSGGSGSTSDAIASVYYATSIGLDITSNSWGGGGFSQALKDAIDDAAANDSLFIAAAGNSAVDNDSYPHYPSSYDSNNIIAVAATDRNDQLASFSCWGLESVDLAAPGVDIYSCFPSNSYSSISGTSMATPHVSGAAALLKSLIPSLTSSEIKSQLLQSVDTLASLDGLMATGGRLNVNNAFIFASGPFLTTTLNSFSESPGNGDGIFNPGEDVDLQLTVQNIGGENAVSVSAVVSTSTSGITVNTGSVAVGNINSGTAQSLAQPFSISIDPAFSTPATVEFTVTYTDADLEIWTDNVYLTVNTSSTVSGRVTAFTGGTPINGATVTYVGTNNSTIVASGEVTTDSNGDYSFSGVEGNYSVSVTALTYNPSSPVAVTLPGDQTGIDFALRRSAIQVTPSSITLTLDPGQIASEVITLSNDGDAELTYSISATAAETTPLGAASIVSYGPEHHKALAKDDVDNRSGQPVTSGSGGPDNFGYTWIDSNEPGGPAYVWNDISSSGTRLNNISGSDDSYEAVNIGFSFPYYDSEYSTIYVSSNGYLTVGSGSSTWGNYPLPSSSAPSGQIAGFADDLRPSGGGDVYYQEIDNKLVVQFNNVAYYSGSGNCTYQMVIDANGSITYYYNSMTGSLTSATVGIQNTSRNDGLTVTYNSSYVQDGLAVRIASTPAWLSFSPGGGTVAPGASAQVNVNFDSTGLITGAHTSSLTIGHNVYGTPDIEVPLTLNVNSFKSLAVSPASINFGTIFDGASTTESISLTNSGNATVTITDIQLSDNTFNTSVSLPLTIQPGASIDVAVNFNPTVVNSYSGTLSIISDSDTSVGSVSLSGIAVAAPVAGLNPDTLNFNLGYNESESQTTTLSNSGGNNLTYEISSITFTNENSGNFNLRKTVRSSDSDLFSYNHKANELIIGYKNGEAGLSNTSLLQQTGLSVVRQLGMTKTPGTGIRSFTKSIFLVESQAGADLTEIREILLQDPNVEYVEPNYIVNAIGTPNDSSFSQLYGMHNTGQTGGTTDADIDAPEAWDIHTGNPNNVLIGVIDTGINYTHPDLVANVWTNPGEIAGNGIDDDGNGYIDDIHGWDFVNNDGDPMDDNAHGSHCMGTIAGAGNNSQGVAGVVWDAKVVGLKFLSSGGSGAIADAVDALIYANAMGVQITNNSWGGGGYSQAMKDAIDAAGAQGYMFIAAAGNSSQNNDSSPSYPSSYLSDNIIAVSATDHNDQLASFSSYGATSVDIAAPGVNVYSTVLGTSYSSFSGTSMATPHVCGVAALLWSYAPTAGGTAVKQAILDSADPLANLSGVVLTGGRLNAFGALQSITPPWLAISPMTGTVAAPGSETITATVDSDGQVAGTYGATAIIETNDPQNPQLQLTINAVISGEKHLSITESSLDFGDVIVGANNTLQLNLSNSGNDHTEISQITLPAGFSHSETLPLVVNAFQSLTVPITFTPDSVSSFSGNLVVDSDASEGQLSIPVSGEGRLGPQISVSPLAISATLNPGETSSEDVNITNNGDMPLDYTIGVLPGTVSQSLSAYGPEHFRAFVKGEKDTRSGNPVIKGSGGPDNFGYSWTDSNEPSGPAFIWNDISATGTRLDSISNTLDGFEQVQLDFVFPYYGIDYNIVYVSSNGYITVGSGSSQWVNYPLPSSSAPTGQIAGFADDMYTAMGGDIYFKLENNKLIVQYNEVAYYSSSGTCTYQMVLDSNGTITYYYNSMTGSLTSATVGIQNSTRDDGLTVVYNSDYVQDGLAVRISTAAPWLTPGIVSGTVQPGNTAVVPIEFAAEEGMEAGTYLCNVLINHNDIGENSVEVAASLTVNNVKSVTTNPLFIAFGKESEGSTITRKVSIKSTGNAPVTINSIISDNPAFTVNASLPATLQIGESLSVEVSFTPDSVGLFNGSLTINGDMDTTPSTVNLTGEGAYGVIERSWSTQGNTSDHRGFVAGNIGVNFPMQIWQYTFNNVSTTPLPVVVGDGKVYGLTSDYFDNGIYMIALDLESGSQEWTFNFADGARGFGAPAYSDGQIFVQRSNHSSDSRLIAISSTDGSQNWATPFSTQWSTFNAPIVGDGRVYINGGYYGGIYGYDADGGQELFFTDLDQEDRWSPAYANGKVYTWTRNYLRELNPNTGVIERVYTSVNYNYDGETVTIAGNMAFASNGNYLEAIDLTTFNKVWQSESISYLSAPSVKGDYVYVSSSTGVHEFNINTGTLERTFNGTFSNSVYQPILTDDTLIASNASQTYIFDLVTGSLIETLPTGGYLSLSGRKLITADNSGNLTAYQLRTVFDINTTIVSGLGSVTSNNATPGFGDDVELQIIADSGYQIKSLMVNGASVEITGSVYSYMHSISGLNEDIDVIVEFEPVFDFALIHTNGSVSVTPVQDSYSGGSVITLTATADPGYIFSHWSSNAGGTFADVNSSSTTFTMPANSVTVTANYSLISTYNLTVSNGSGSGSYSSGAEVPITANPPVNGYEFSHWSSSAGGSFANANNSSTTFTMPASAVTVTANYQLKTYTVTFDLGNGSLGNNSAPLVQNIDHGQAATAPTVVPPENFNFTGWSASFDNVTSNLTIIAQYESILTGQRVARYRVYNPNDGHHHYTTNFAEYDFLGTVGWNQEGISCYIYDSQISIDSVLSNVYYRTYNPNSGEHFCTMSEGEYNFLGTVGWNLEGTDGHLFDQSVTDSVPLYRLYNPNSGYHHWTIDSNERNFLISLGWNDEGIAGYVFQSPN